MNDSEPKKPRDGHSTQWAAQHAVASELYRRGYYVAMTLGNTPHLDLLVRSPKGLSFGVEVKSLYKRNDWWVKRKPLDDNLFYFLVFAPDPDKGSIRFFIMTHAEVLSEIDAWEKTRDERRTALGKGPGSKTFEGFHWDGPKKYEDNWYKLPR